MSEMKARHWVFVGICVLFALVVLVWRWNHEMVRVYDLPPIWTPWNTK